MAMDMSLLVPSNDKIESWKTLGDVIEWSRVDTNVAQSMLMVLGDKDCQSIPLFAMTDPETMRRLIGTLQISTEGGPRALTAFEKARLNLMYAAPRARMKLSLVDICTQQEAAAPEQNGAAKASAQKGNASDPAGVKVKIGNTFDQGSDMETTMLTPEEIRAKRRIYLQVFGDPPDPDENITDKQLFALSRVVTAR
jgi:hypothetical protein